MVMMTIHEAEKTTDCKKKNAEVKAHVKYLDPSHFYSVSEPNGWMEFYLQVLDSRTSRDFRKAQRNPGP